MYYRVHQLLKLFGLRPTFSFQNFKGPLEEWVCVEKHPMGDLFFIKLINDVLNIFVMRILKNYIRGNKF